MGRGRFNGNMVRVERSGKKKCRKDLSGIYKEQERKRRGKAAGGMLIGIKKGLEGREDIMKEERLMVSEVN